jgi:hypothetical protein
MYRRAGNSPPSGTFIRTWGRLSLNRDGRLAHRSGFAQPMTACDNPEEHYRFGVDLFIGGLATVAAARAGAAEPPLA